MRATRSRCHDRPVSEDRRWRGPSRPSGSPHGRGEGLGAGDLAAVNHATRRVWTVLRPLPGGRSDSVELLGCGPARAVVKIKHGAWWDGQLARTAELVDGLRAAGYPTPPVLAYGPLGGDRFYLATAYAPGVQPAGLDAALARDVLAAVDLHAAVRPPEIRDWSAMVTFFLAGDVAGREFPPGLADLARRALDLVPRPIPALPSDDFVHGDFTSRNLLTRGGCLSAVIDVEGFGRGTRTIDLVALLTSRIAPGDRSTIRLIVERAIAASDERTFRACLAHRVLAALIEAPEDPSWLDDVARRARTLLALAS